MLPHSWDDSLSPQGEATGSCFDKRNRVQRNYSTLTTVEAVLTIIPERSRGTSLICFPVVFVVVINTTTKSNLRRKWVLSSYSYNPPLGEIRAGTPEETMEE